jgi:hypothetical protein
MAIPAPAFKDRSQLTKLPAIARGKGASQDRALARIFDQRSKRRPFKSYVKTVLEQK